MHKNYQAWEINYQEFYEKDKRVDKLAFLLHFAVLAPSSHNSQPWKFRVDENQIAVLPNPERLLDVADHDRRFLYIALGFALENILIAADYYNLETQVEYFPANMQSAAAKVSFKENPDPSQKSQKHLIFAIPQRRSNRNKYTQQMPNEEFLDQIKNSSTAEVEVTLVTERANKEKIADMLMQARLRAFDNKDFRAELANYKRNNLTRSSFGMPGFTMGFSTPLSLVAPFLIRHVNVMKLIKKREEELLKKYTPVLAIISTKEDSNLAALKAGQTLARVTLEAERQKVQTAMSAVPLNPKELRGIIHTTFRPQLLLRMGYANQIPKHSPRFTVSEVLTS